jgi:hypothetical protein
MSRAVTHRYEDALDRIWLTAAERVGLRVVRSDDVYASTDGRGVLTIGGGHTLDADDCLAQMIFHELCHSVVQGPESLEQPDWGLDNEGDRHLHREHACLRLQAHLAGHHGLRLVFAPTTEHRVFYDTIFERPLDGDDESVVLAKTAASRARRWPWAPHLEDALAASAAIGEVVAPFAAGGSLWSRFEGKPAAHPSGLPQGRAGTCGSCAWQRTARGGLRCLQAEARVEASWSACERYEASLDCRGCGACCREAYGVVEIGKRDPFVRAHPELVEREGDRIVLLRKDGRCPALEGTREYTCRVYEDRPRTCRDFELGSANCLEARRRVGLSL